MKLSNEEFNVLEKIATKSKMDRWFQIARDDKNNDVVYDREEDSYLSLYNGIAQLDSGITNLDDYGLTKDEQICYWRLVSRLNIIQCERNETLLYNCVEFLIDRDGITDDEICYEMGMEPEELEELWDKFNPKLPDEVKISASDVNYVAGQTSEDELDEAIGDYLSNTYGYCQYHFNYDIIENGLIHIYDIEWDTND